MTLATASEQQLWDLRDHLKGAFRERDRLWDNRRRVRYRRMEGELRQLPLNSRVADTALMVYQTEGPNQEAHKRVKRLVANRPRFEVVLFESSPEVQGIGQRLEDGVKALYKWMNRGKTAFDWLSTQFQQGDGLGIGKIDFLPGHGSSLAPYNLDDLTRGEGDDTPARREFREARDSFPSDDIDRDSKAYNKITDRALRSELPPFRLSAIDPLTCYWWEDGDGIALIAETGKKSLNPLLEAFRDYGLKLSDDKRRLVVLEPRGGEMDAIGGQTIPESAPNSEVAKDLSSQVEYVEIRDRDQIVILIEHPKLVRGQGVQSQTTDSGRGVMLRFPNPFGPYTTGYTLIPGDVTTEAAPSDRYQPPILGALNVAQPLNVLMTARLSASIEEALVPSYVQVTPDTPLPPSDEEKTPETRENREIPVVQGQIKKVEAPGVDLDKVDARILADAAEFKVQEAIMGEATSDTSGHRLAIQVAQADIQMVPYQNARADAITELMKGIVYAVRKHGLTVYIPTLPDSSIRSGEKLRIVEPASITPEMADLPFELIVTLGAETPVTKYAKWQALAQREEQGTAGYMTVVEQSDVENPEEEVGRVFEGKLLKATMEQIVPELVEMVRAFAKRRLEEALPPPEPPPGMEMGIPPETGLAQGGGGEVGAPDLARVPGVQMPLMPTTKDFGPPVQEGGGEMGGVSA